jgi:hypothetical protein
MTEKNSITKQNLIQEVNELMVNLPDTTSWDDLVTEIYNSKNLAVKFNHPTQAHNTLSYHPDNVTVIGVIAGIVALLFWFLPFISVPLVPIALAAGVYGALKSAEKAYVAIIIGLVALISNPVMSPFSGVIGLGG